MKPEYQKLLDLAQSRKKANKQLLTKLKKMKPKELDRIIHALHDRAFEKIDCLECANCCKSISPSVKDKDIDRISRSIRIKPSAVIEKYMCSDEDDDYIMNTSPCPLLLADNYCSIYEARPLACKGYPHTDQNKMHQILDLTLKNTSICPAVCFVFEELRKI